MSPNGAARNSGRAGVGARVLLCGQPGADDQDPQDRQSPGSFHEINLPRTRPYPRISPAACLWGITLQNPRNALGAQRGEP